MDYIVNLYYVFEDLYKNNIADVAHELLVALILVISGLFIKRIINQRKLSLSNIDLVNQNNELTSEIAKNQKLLLEANSTIDQFKSILPDGDDESHTLMHELDVIASGQHEITKNIKSIALDHNAHLDNYDSLNQPIYIKEFARRSLIFLTETKMHHGEKTKCASFILAREKYIYYEMLLLIKLSNYKYPWPIFDSEFFVKRDIENIQKIARIDDRYITLDYVFSALMMICLNNNTGITKERRIEILNYVEAECGRYTDKSLFSRGASQTKLQAMIRIAEIFPVTVAIAYVFRNQLSIQIEDKNSELLKELLKSSRVSGALRNSLLELAI